MPTPELKVAYITAGAAGMFCGSCMHDNTLVRALRRANIDIQLIPTYTPVRTDEEDVSIDQVFFGGINIFLQQKIPLFRHLPRLVDRWFDNPKLLRWVSSRAMKTSSKDLGALTISMLKGKSGHQRKEVDRLIRWLQHDVQPDLVVFSNMLVAGCIPALKRQLNVPVLVTLQGDDIFIDDLPADVRNTCLQLIRQLVDQVDGFLVNSQYYGKHMAECFSIDLERLRQVPLGIDTEGFPQHPNNSTDISRPPTIGYLARLAPEKGLHLLVEAFIEVRKQVDDAQLKIAGWLGPNNEEYVQQQWQKLAEAGLSNDFEYVGSVDRQGKLDFLGSIDVLSVPTTYREPKGLFVLESLAAGVPVVQPNHGAFPELLEMTSGGVLVPPHDVAELAAAITDLLNDAPRRIELGSEGQDNVHAQFNSDAMARKMLELYREYVKKDET